MSLDRANLQLWMFLLVTFANISYAQETNTKAIDIPKAEIIATDTYDPRNEPGRGFSTFTSTLGLITFGQIAVAGLDIKADVLSKLEQDELKKYFPNRREREKIASDLDKKIRTNLQTQGLSHQNINKSSEYAATELVSVIVKRVLETEGIKDPARRQAWANRILRPFQTCMKRSITYVEGGKCLTSLQSDVVKNLGLAMSIELVRQEIGDDFVQPKVYLKCLRPKTIGADDRVKGCVIQSIRAAALTLGESKIKAAAQAEVPSASLTIVSSGKKLLQSCLANAKDRKDFSECADQLAIKTGGLIAREVTASHPQIVQLLKDKKARISFAEKSRAFFEKCLLENKNKNKRASNGSLEIESCSTATKLVAAKEVFKLASNEGITSFVKDKNKSITLATENSTRTDACWNETSEEKSNECARSSTISLISSIANILLKQEIPEKMLEDNPKVITKNITEVSLCLSEKLPRKILSSDTTGQEIESCIKNLVRSVASQVAKHKLKLAVDKQNISPEEASRIIDTIADKNLQGCLRDDVSAKQLEKCTVEAKKQAAYSFSKHIFEKELNSFFTDRGGVEKYNIKDHDVESAVSKVMLEQSQCLSKIANSAPTAKQDQEVENCVKPGVSQLAVFAADLEFRRRAREQLPNGVDFEPTASSFRREFSLCLNEKANAPVVQMIEQIESCRIRMTVPYMTKLAKSQIDAAIDTALPADSERLRREQLKESLNLKYERCLKATAENDGGARTKCSAYIKKDTVFQLVKESARVNARKVLQRPKPPEGLEALENEFDACISSDASPEECGTSHIKKTALLLSSLSINSVFASLLGKDGLKHEADKLKNLESGFSKCLSSVPNDRLDNSFATKVQECIENLENDSKELARKVLEEKVRRPGSTKDEQELRVMTAQAVPCLDTFFPKSPFEENSVRNIGPQGTFDLVALSRS